METEAQGAGCFEAHSRGSELWVLGSVSSPFADAPGVRARAMCTHQPAEAAELEEGR